MRKKHRISIIIQRSSWWKIGRGGSKGWGGRLRIRVIIRRIMGIIIRLLIVSMAIRIIILTATTQGLIIEQGRTLSIMTHLMNSLYITSN